MITSPQNEKLKLVRKLRDRKHREREGLFASEGEDLVEAGLAAGVEPRFLLIAAGSGLVDRWGGEEVEPELLAAASGLGSGTRAIAVWPLRWAERQATPCLYLHGVADPGNVGTIIRSADALLGGAVVLGPELRGSVLAKGRAGQHGLGLRPAAGARRAGGDPGAAGGARRPRWRWAGGVWRGRRRSASVPSARDCRRRSCRSARSR